MIVSKKKKWTYLANRRIVVDGWIVVKIRSGINWVLERSEPWIEPKVTLPPTPRIPRMPYWQLAPPPPYQLHPHHSSPTVSSAPHVTWEIANLPKSNWWTDVFQTCPVGASLAQLNWNSPQIPNIRLTQHFIGCKCHIICIMKIDTIPTMSLASSLTSSAASKWKVSSTVQRTAWLSSARWRLGVYWRAACRWAQTDLLGTSHKLIKAKVKIIKKTKRRRMSNISYYIVNWLPRIWTRLMNTSLQMKKGSNINAGEQVS